MYFTVISSGNDCESYSIYAYGTLGSIASILLDESRNAMTIESDWEVDDFENDDWYHGEFEDYKTLKNGDITEETVSRYHFSLQDMYTDTKEFISTCDEVEKKIAELLEDSGYVLAASNDTEKEETLMDLFDQLDSYDEIDYERIRHINKS